MKRLTALREEPFISVMSSFHFHSDLLASLSSVSRSHYYLPALWTFSSPLPLSQNICCFVQAVLSAHDTVAQKNFDPVLPPLPEELDDDFEEESVKIVRLVKNKEPLVRKVFVFNVNQVSSQVGKKPVQSCRHQSG